jgi:hypothetical protein
MVFSLSDIACLNVRVNKRKEIDRWTKEKKEQETEREKDRKTDRPKDRKTDAPRNR